MRVRLSHVSVSNNDSKKIGTQCRHQKDPIHVQTKFKPEDKAGSDCFSHPPFSGRPEIGSTQ